MSNDIIRHVKNILEKFDYKYINKDGSLNRNKVITDLDNFDEKLMTILLNDPLINDTYVQLISGIEVFNINKFVEMFEYKEYWENSYTKYTNKIGLSSDNKFITDGADVVLNFPFKDCTLEGGMISEDEEDDDEEFLNETIAKPEIDELLEPKIFKNVKKIDKDGEHEVDNFDYDNLIIKGNNLIALYSLKKRYLGKINLIYLDPPFNTKNDSFKYNDRFSQSTWLTFMKNRLEIAKELLSDDGSIIVHLDGNQGQYCKVLMDSIFGKSNFINEIIWHYRTYIGRVKDYLPKKHDNIYWYSKTSNHKFKSSNVGNYEDTPDYDRWGKYLDDKGQIRYGNHPKTDSRFDAYLRRYKKQYGEPKVGDIVYVNKGYVVDDVWEDVIALDAKNKTERVTEFGGSGQKPEALLQRIISMVTDKNDIVLDCFMGSATTQAASMKMGRRFIGVEQMDYINTISVPRLKKVIDGDQSGISKYEGWHGGGSFIYAELMEKNISYINKVRLCKNNKELDDVYDEIKELADVDYRAKLDEYKIISEDVDFKMKRKLLCSILDKNQLYYNYSNIDDLNLKKKLSESEYKFNKSFYNSED